MPDLYVPPPGAMQFEFDPGWEDRGRKWVWVQPVPDKPCPDGRNAYRNLEWPGLLMCECHGRIIE